MNLLALDLSLTSTGWAAKFEAQSVASGTFCPKAQGVQRLQEGARWIETLVGVYRPSLILLEGYSFGSGVRGSATRAHSTGEFGGVIRLRIYQLGIPMVEIAPAVRAKFAAGKGNAGKDQVLVEAVKRLGYQGHSKDEADALWLLQAGLIRYGQPGAIRPPQAHLAALDSVEWPSDLLLQRAS